MKKIIVLIFIVVANISLLTGQQILENNKGQFILINEDQTFRVLNLNNKDDVVLLKKFQNLSNSDKEEIETVSNESNSEIQKEIDKIEIQLEILKEESKQIKNNLKAYKAMDVPNKKVIERLKNKIKSIKGERKFLKSEVNSLKKQLGNLGVEKKEKHVDKSSWGTLKRKKKKEKVKNYTTKKEHIEYEAYKPEMNFNLHPPAPDCEIASQKIDEFTGKKYSTLKPKTIFTFTDPRVRHLYENSDFLTCVGTMSKAGGDYYLTIDVSIRSANAKNEYGMLERGSMIMLKLINGKTLNLKANNGDIGVLDKAKGIVNYKTTYTINHDLAKELVKSELDKVRIIWSTGYEEYEVYFVDFFIDNIFCLKQL